MRNFIFIFFITLASCNQSEKKDFLGSWYLCDYYGQLSEIHISSDELIFNFNAPNGWYNPYTYEITNDTLFYFDTLYNWRDKQGNPTIIKNQLISNSNNTLTFLFGKIDSTAYEWTFQKFPHELNEFQENDSISKSRFMDEEFYKRSELIECQDLQTEEEKKLDSIKTNEIIKYLI